MRHFVLSGGYDGKVLVYIIVVAVHLGGVSK
jgi:hypothetical protein